MDKGKFPPFSDKELLDKFHETGNNQWLGMLLQRYTLLLFGVCMKYLKDEEKAKDGVQQIFLKAIAELEKYKVEYFKSWLYMVARNYCLMQFRNKQDKLTKPLNEYITQDEKTLLEKKENERLYNVMEQSLNELNNEQRTCIALFYLQKKSYNEIMAYTNFSLMQVKSHIQNGKRNLKQLIEKKMKSYDRS